MVLRSYLNEPNFKSRIVSYCINPDKVYDCICTYNGLADFIKGKNTSLITNGWQDFLYEVADENHKYILQNNFKYNLSYHQAVFEKISIKEVLNEIKNKGFKDYEYHTFKSGEDSELLVSFFQQEDFVHELGHVKCDMEIHKKNSHRALEYTYRSLYQEVMPYYYEQKFLEFLVFNNICKQEALDVLFDNLDKCHDDVKKSKRLLNKKALPYKKLFSTLSYSYGFLIANSLVFSPDMKRQFESIQYDDFSADTFFRIGFTPERLQNDLKKYTKQYFK